MRLLINPSANLFVFGDFNVHQKDWLTYSGVTMDLVNPVTIFLSQMALLRWLTSLLKSLTMTLTVLPFWIYLFLLMLVLLLQRLSHWEFLITRLSVCIDFPPNSKWDVLFHHIAYDYSLADWGGLHFHLINVPWEDIFKLTASAAASEYCEWAHVEIDVYIFHRKYQLKPNSSPWFSANFAVTIVHRNHFFHLWQQNKSFLI